MTIMVYSLSGCASCRMTERFLRKSGAQFQVLDASEHADELSDLGFRSAPVVVPDGGRDEAWSGFRESNLSAAVAAQTAQVSPVEAPSPRRRAGGLLEAAGMSSAPRLDTAPAGHDDAREEQPTQHDDQQQTQDHGPALS